MPILSNPKHERFAQALAIGHPASVAYTEAGYVYNEGNASRLKSNEKVTARLAEILEEAHKVNMEVTRESILAELEEARQLAITNNQSSAAVQAAMGKARVQGLIIDRREVGDPGEFSEMTDAELVAKAARDARELGIAGPMPVEDTPDEGEAA